jgi:glycosyltransferase involved in cell wall biosynthesis
VKVRSEAESDYRSGFGDTVDVLNLHAGVISMPSCPMLTVGMPVYNADRFLAKALDSFLGQTFKDFELLISDNASTDRTEEICREYAARDHRIRYFRNPQNMGAGWNFRRVYSLANEKYYKYAAHDDFIEPTFLEECTAALEADPGLVLAHARTETKSRAAQMKSDVELTEKSARR